MSAPSTQSATTLPALMNALVLTDLLVTDTTVLI